jgi:hypothetical protein
LSRLTGPPRLHDSSLINQKIIWLRHNSAFVNDAVAPDHVHCRKIAEKREGEIERCGERLLRERITGGEPKNLNVQVFELAELGLPGREVRGSGGVEILRIEKEQHRLLSLELAQADALPRGTRERKIWGLFPDRYCLTNQRRERISLTCPFRFLPSVDEKTSHRNILNKTSNCRWRD